jgi:hypothetical protein
VAHDGIVRVCGSETKQFIDLRSGLHFHSNSLNLRLARFLSSPPLPPSERRETTMQTKTDDSLRSQAAANYLSDRVGHPITTRLLEGWRNRRIGPPWLRIGGIVLYPRAGLDSFITSASSARRRRARPAGKIEPSQSAVT